MAANGLRTQRNDHAYFCVDDSLPFYLKMITLDPTATSELTARAKAISGIKDSFSCLDVDLLGLKVAFDAAWIWRETNQQSMPADWVRIKTAHDISKWHQSWMGNGSPTDKVIFPPKCLKNPNLAFFARVLGTKIEAGCIANLSSRVVGMSNVFSANPSDPSLFEQASSAVGSFGNGRPVVGYEHGADLDAATSAGFQTVGPLRVLIR